MIANIIRNAKKTVAGGDPYYSAVSLLLPMDGTNGSTTFTDSGPNAITVTAVGNAQISTSQSKYGGASGYFGGSTDRITAVTTNSTFTGDFTWECWFYPTSDTNTYKALFSAGSETTGRYVLLQYGSNIVVDLYGVGQNINVSCGITANSGWHHVALVRSGTTVTLYYDGVSKATATRSGTVGNTNGFFCGNNSAGTNPYNGYIDDLRISLFARYTSTFSPPTAALPTTASSTPADPYYGYTSLLLHMDGSSGSTAFVDSGPNALAVTAVGNAQISTTQNKYGGASGSFDGSGDYLSISSNPLFNFGTGDFTMELWAKLPNDNVDYSLISGSVNGNMDFRRESVGRISLGRAGVAWDANSSVINIANQWTHLAASRSGSTLRLFCNGIQIYAGSNSVSYSVASLQIGRSTGVSAVDLNGYIDDLRITKGVARYQSSFTPPTQAHPNIYNPYTTLPVSGAALWLDASQQNTIFTDAGTTPVTTSGQSVYQWNDLSGNNRHAVQATSGNRPTWVPPASGQNGLGVANFNGSNNFFVGQWQNFTDLTLFIVARNTNASSPGGRMFSQSDDTYMDNVQTPTTTYIPVGIIGTSQFISTNSSNQVIMSVSFPNNTYQRFIHRRTGTTGSNTVGSTTTAGTIGTVTRNITRYCMGRRTNGTDGNWAGQICEVIAFPRQLTSGEEASINSYLNTKWGTP